MYPLFLAVEVRIRLALLTNRISARLTSRHCSAFLNFVYLRLYPLFLAVPWWLLHKEHETLSCNKYLWPNNPTLLLSTLSAGVQIIWYIKAPLCWALYIPTVMESTRFDNSTKDIPIPSETEYKRKLIEKTEQLCKRIIWKAFFFLNPCADGSRKETFGFSSQKSPPQVHTMLNFEKRLLGMIENIKFQKVKCEFQKKAFHRHS